jgi:CO/xanthine dehydrogenase FAD-binding subunit
VKPFEYLHPKSIAELRRILSRYDGKARMLAGGTDLLVMMKQGKVEPDYIVSLKGVPDLAYIREQRDGGIRIGAMTLLREIESSGLIRDRYPLLSRSAGSIGSPQVRWRATCGGNLCNGAPSADLAPPLVCLGAQAVIQGKEKRKIAMEEFFLGPGKVDLEKGEFLKELIIPPLPSMSFGAYLKFTRSAMDIAVVGVGVVATFETGGECRDLRICLGAVAPTPLRAVGAERVGIGKIWNDETLAAMARTASEESKPITDVRGTIFLRKTLVETLTRRALGECLQRSSQT